MKTMKKQNNWSQTFEAYLYTIWRLCTHGSCNKYYV